MMGLLVPPLRPRTKSQFQRCRRSIGDVQIDASCSMLNKLKYRLPSKALQRIGAVNAPPMVNAEHGPA
jgi:hypothetical protein